MKRSLRSLYHRAPQLVHSLPPPSFRFTSLRPCTLHSPSLPIPLPPLARLSSISAHSSPSPSPHPPTPSPQPRDRILLHGLLFHGHHGVYPEERVLGQKFVVDLSLTLSLTRAALSGELAQSIDYGELYGEVRKVVEGTQCRLLEEVAWQLVALVMGGYEGRVEEVVVSVKKPHVAVQGVVDYLGVELTRSRTQWEDDTRRIHSRKRHKDITQVALE